MIRCTLFFRSPVTRGWTSINVATASESDPAVVAARREIEAIGLRVVTKIVFW